MVFMKKLGEKEYIEIWDKVYDLLHFNLSHRVNTGGIQWIQHYSRLK
jgi:hypothetical protein